MVSHEDACHQTALSVIILLGHWIPDLQDLSGGLPCYFTRLTLLLHVR